MLKLVNLVANGRDRLIYCVTKIIPGVPEWNRLAILSGKFEDQRSRSDKISRSIDMLKTPIYDRNLHAVMPIAFLD